MAEREKPWPPEACGLCGQEALGFGLDVGPEHRMRLCHDAKRDCYHRWTVYGERPGYAKRAESVGLERYVRATD